MKFSKLFRHVFSFSLITFCISLFSLSLFYKPCYKTLETSADSTSIYNYSGTVSRFDFGTGFNIPYRFSNVDYELNVSDTFNSEVHTYLYTFYIKFSSPNYVDYTSLDGEDDYTANPLFSSGNDIASNSYSSTNIFDRLDVEIVGVYCRYSNLFGTIFDFNMNLNFYENNTLIDTAYRIYSYFGVYNLGDTWRNEAFINGNLDDAFTSVNIDTSSISDYSMGYSDGYNSGYSSGYSSGNADGYNNGYTNGYNDGVASQQQVIQNAYNSGYSNGYNEGSSQDTTVMSIFSGILQVAMVPINFFLAIFNFEILGINLSGFIRALFTIAITIIVIKAVIGGKGASED